MAGFILNRLDGPILGLLVPEMIDFGMESLNVKKDLNKSRNGS